LDTSAPRLEMRGISKRFGGALAVDDVSLSASAGEILAILGENGAGKSTLMKVLAGTYSHGSFNGEILLDGVPQQFSSVAVSEAAGIVMIPQELIQAKDLTVAENMFANHLPGRWGLVDWQCLHDETGRWLNEFEIDAKPHTPMRALSRAQQQLVEIAKALSRNARVLILDEPTSALTDTEAAGLLVRLRQMRHRGVTALYISHRIEEIMAIADRALVLRDGRVAGGGTLDRMDHPTLVSMIVGRGIREMYPYEVKGREHAPLLEVRISVSSTRIIAARTSLKT